MYSAYYGDGAHRMNVFPSQDAPSGLRCWDCGEEVVSDGTSFHHVDPRSTCRPVSNSRYRHALQSAYFSPLQCEPLIGGHRPAALIGNTAFEFIEEPYSLSEFWLRCRDYRRHGFNSVWIFRMPPEAICLLTAAGHSTAAPATPDTLIGFAAANQQPLTTSSPVPKLATDSAPAGAAAIHPSAYNATTAYKLQSPLPEALSDYTPPMGDHSLLGPALIVGSDRSTVARAIRRLDGYLGVSVYLDIAAPAAQATTTSEPAAPETPTDTAAVGQQPLTPPSPAPTPATPDNPTGFAADNSAAVNPRTLYRLDSFGTPDHPGDRSIVNLTEPVSPESLIASVQGFSSRHPGKLIEPDSTAPAIAMIESIDSELYTTARMRSVYTTIRLRNASGRYARSFEIDLSAPSAACRDMLVWLVDENAVLAPQSEFSVSGFKRTSNPPTPAEIRSALKSDFRSFFQNGEIGALSQLISSRVNASRMTPPPTSRFLAPLASRGNDLKVICFDTETTGLEDDDEVVQLSIADAITGEQLLNEYFRPSDALMERGWDEAAAVTDIWPEDVKDCRSLTDPEVFSMIQGLFDWADLVIGYHVVYDIHMLEKAGFCLRDKVYNDPMYGFAAHYWFTHPDETHTTKRGKVISPWLDWSFNPYTNRKGKWINKNLSFAAEQFGITDFGAHDSMNDVNATIEVWKQMCDIQRSIETHGYARGEHGELLGDPMMQVYWSDDHGKPVSDPDGYAISFAADYTVEDLEGLDK